MAMTASCMLTRRAALLLTAAALAACATSPIPQAPAEVRQALAPGGTLRVAVYPGSPTSLVREAPPDEMRGLTVELGRELGRRLGVPVQMVQHQRVAEIIEALKAGTVDMTITNATPARAADVDFSPTVVALELGYLSLPGSPVQSLAAVDQPGVRIGVTQGSSSQGVLTRELKQARVVPVPSLKDAREQLQARQLDAFATNKGILFELADQLPGATVLPGRWGLEQLAIGVPKGRQAGAAFIRQFASDMRAAGRVRAAAERAGLRGLAAD
jgi:polar amino acid transport system substrate-binding protein